MALAAGIIWEVRGDKGSDTNGGGFKAGASGSDWSQQDAAQYSVTDAVTAGTTTVTSATANFGTDVVGNVCYIAGGTGSVVADWYEITARTDASTITVDRSTGLTAGTGVTLKIGGALATVARAVTEHVGQNKIYVKKSTVDYLPTATLSLSAGTTAARTALIGYNSTRGDLDYLDSDTAFTNDPVIRMDNATAFVVTCDANLAEVRNFHLHGGTAASKAARGLSGTGSNLWIDRVKVSNFTAFGIVLSGTGLVRRCWATANIAGATSGFWASNAGLSFEDCVASALTCPGYTHGGGSPRCRRCLAINCTGASSDGFAWNTGEICDCVAYGCGRDGIRITASGGDTCGIYGNILVNNGAYGINFATNYGSVPAFSMDYNFTYNNTSGARNQVPAGDHDVALSGDPFTNAAGNDFSLNNTASAGASVRAASYPGAVPGLSTTGYRDGGPIQHQSAAAGGGLRLAGHGGLAS